MFMGFAGAKRGGALKSSFGVAMQAIREGAILIRNGEEGVPTM